jgi:uncharacterized membrane protein YphA (DoxX/SURF4 family)
VIVPRRLPSQCVEALFICERVLRGRRALPRSWYEKIPIYGDSLSDRSGYSFPWAGNPGRKGLQKLYSTFPDGRYGSGLLLLRVVLAATLMVQGLAYLSGQKDLRFELWAVGVLSLCSGCSLLIGLLTPLGGATALLLGIGATLSRLPAPSWHLFGGNLLNLDTLALAVTAILLGPGAFSIDARLFGRRKIIIPRPSAS